MMPFPPNSLGDTDNERPHSESLSATVGPATGPISNANHQQTSTSTNNKHRSNGINAAPTAAKRATRHSWPGQLWTARVRQKFGFESFLIKEVLAVALWAATVPLLSLVIARLLGKVAMRQEWQRQGDARFLLAVVAWLLLRVLPPKLQTAEGAPGFLLSHVWVLLRIHSSFNVFPNLGCRICEWRLGRIPKRAMILSFLVHSVVPCVVWWFLSVCGPKEFSLYEKSSLFVLSYKDDDEKKLLYLFQEVLACTLFPVSVMVVPALLKLNDYPEWLAVVILYPLYSMGVDLEDRGSSLSVGALLAQSLLFGTLQANRWRLAAQLLGNAFAGMIMQNCFPDEPVL